MQVDESVVTKRKYGLGRLVREQWVLGLYDVTERRGTVVFVPDRSANTLKERLCELILPGTEI